MLLRRGANILAVSLSALLAISLVAAQEPEVVGKSPWGPTDEIGTLNLMTDASRGAVLSRVAGGKVYDLAAELFNGMPSWYLLGGSALPVLAHSHAARYSG